MTVYQVLISHHWLNGRALAAGGSPSAATVRAIHAAAAGRGAAAATGSPLHPHRPSRRPPPRHYPGQCPRTLPPPPPPLPEGAPKGRPPATRRLMHWQAPCHPQGGACKRPHPASPWHGTQNDTFPGVDARIGAVRSRSLNWHIFDFMQKQSCMHLTDASSTLMDHALKFFVRRLLSLLAWAAGR